MKIITAGKAVRVQLGHNPKTYQATITIGRHFRVLKRKFKTATQAEQYAQRFVERVSSDGNQST